MKETIYALSDQERQEIDQKLRELLSVCQIYHVPMFASCAVANTEDGNTEYQNIIYTAQSHSLNLNDDKIRQYMLIANGSHEAVLKRENVTFDPFGVLKNEK